MLPFSNIKNHFIFLNIVCRAVLLFILFKPPDFLRLCAVLSPKRPLTTDFSYLFLALSIRFICFLLRQLLFLFWAEFRMRTLPRIGYINGKLLVLLSAQRRFKAIYFVSVLFKWIRLWHLHAFILLCALRFHRRKSFIKNVHLLISVEVKIFKLRVKVWIFFS